MLTTSQLITAFSKRGITLTVTDGKLRYRAPRGVITANDKALLTAHKAELVTSLRQSLPKTPSIKEFQDDIPLSAPTPQPFINAAVETVNRSCAGLPEACLRCLCQQTDLKTMMQAMETAALLGEMDANRHACQQYVDAWHQAITKQQMNRICPNCGKATLVHDRKGVVCFHCHWRGKALG